MDERAAASMIRIEVVTLFPEMVEGAAAYGVMGRALERGIWTLGCRNPRDFATDSYRTVDDRPLRRRAGDGDAGRAADQGAGRGAARLRRRVSSARRSCYLSPQGEPLSHARVVELAAGPG